MSGGAEGLLETFHVIAANAGITMKAGLKDLGLQREMLIIDP